LDRRKAILRAIGRGALRALIVLVRVLPLPAALALGRGIGVLMRCLSGRRYRVALKNLRIAYGDSLSDAERKRIARESFCSFGMFAVESIKFAYMPKGELNRRLTAERECAEVVLGALEEKKGCLLITGHLGNFEIAGCWLTAQGKELIALAREARDRGTTDLMRQMRERMGIKVVTLNQSLKSVLVGLKRNACVAIVCDQNASDVFVPFFGHPTGTVDGPARIALRTGAPMVFFACVRDGRGGYRLMTSGRYDARPTGDEQADIVRVTTEINRRLEEFIRRYPEQWLWFHDRWKSSPGVGG
jgi:KDO2-lipid IV(A) lauroyltransferase